MPPRFKPYPKDYYQSQLSPTNVFDLLPEDHECFPYRACSSKWTRRQWRPSTVSRSGEPTAARQIGWVLIYAYSHGVFSSRRSRSAAERIRGPVHCGAELFVLPGVERFSEGLRRVFPGRLQPDCAVGDELRKAEATGAAVVRGDRSLGGESEPLRRGRGSVPPGAEELRVARSHCGGLVETDRSRDPRHMTATAIYGDPPLGV